MSLLPQQIPPQTEPWGTVDEKGIVTIDKNWWLFLFNIGKQTLSAPSSPVPVTAATATALFDTDEISSTDAIQDARRIVNAVALEAQDIELARFDAADLPRRIVNTQLLDLDQDVPLTQKDINNAQLLQPDQDIGPTLRDVSNAIALASDGLLPDPAPQAQPTVVVSVSGSPFTYTAPATGLVSITGGTVSLISIIRQTSTVATGITSGLIPVRRGDQVQISQSGVPTMIFLPN